ncbi:MAG: hypothetical protein HY769_00445 [Candidatus Stahlbacteria bacterium]|nr:hypothetical protein [Candidatus Stahlbacteria bacterium]
MNNVLATYLKTRDHYFLNAQECIKKKEWRKASELLWGTITQSIKALASIHGIRISSHNQFFGYMEGISQETGDKEFYILFDELNNLHRNFYEEVIPPASFPIIYEKTLWFLEKIDNLQKKVSPD